MVRHITLLAMFWLLTIFASAQLTLNECLNSTRVNYPLAKAKEQISSASLAKLKAIQAQYYPQIDLTGQITWQNDVPHTVLTTVPFEMPTGSKDQYKSFVDIKQLIYDGGAVASTKKIESIKQDVDKKGIDVEMRQAEAAVIQAFFMVLLIDKQMAQLFEIRKDLEARLKETQGKVKSGVVLQSSASLFEVEILRTEQRQISFSNLKKTAIDFLIEYTGLSLYESSIFEIPSETIAQTPYNRPELNLIEMQSMQLEATKSLSTAARLPKVSAFSQLGYGNPGYNMLNDSFEPFFMVGARLNWTVLDWQKSKNDKVALSHQQQVLEQRHQTVMSQIKLQEIDLKSKIVNLEQSILIDQKIVELRKSITKTALAQLNSGTITAADYISRLQEEAVAQLNYDLHKIDIEKAKAELKFALGN